jgi:SAM-dependent MidA family methyltransferase
MADASSPDDEERQARVIARLRDAGDASGFVPFDRFMEIALYATDVGYYASPRSPLGTEGDFYTAAHVTPLFAATIAERIREVRAVRSGPFRIVELGPGDGTLAAGILRALHEKVPGVEYVLVDRSAARAAEAERRARGDAGTVPLRVSNSLSADGPFAGVVLANEFLDAQPARRLRWDGARWHETGVRVVDAVVRAAELDSAAPVPGAPLPTPEDADVVLEVAPAAEATIREVGDHLTDGTAIFLDYGLEEPELLRAHPRGTLAAVRRHRFVPDPLDAPGATDLSTFVNFTRARRAARASGLTEIAYRPQAEALGAWGFPALLEAAVRNVASPQEEVRLRLAAKNLLFGFERFRALELAPRGAAAR